MIDIMTDISQFQVGRPAPITRADLEKLELVQPGVLPNQRTLIIPDPGMTLIDMDLNRADAQFVAWEANDKSLKDALRSGEDIHWLNAKMIWGEHVKQESHERQMARQVIHAMNYGAYPKKISRSFGVQLKMAEWVYKRWFELHPGIREWHNRTRNELATKRLVRNRFGYERYYFDRPENCLNEALGWVPQSSVGIIINTAWDAIDTHLKEVEVLMQCHDSLTMQVPSRLTRELLPRIQELSLITVPYDDPLIVPVGFKISDKSWGDITPACCKDIQQAPSDKCKDHELHSWLATGLQNAKQKASYQLA